MIDSTATVPVNPQGETARTHDQLWQGLVLKARDTERAAPLNTLARTRQWLGKGGIRSKPVVAATIRAAAIRGAAPCTFRRN